MDKKSSKKNSPFMARFKSQNTKPEKIVRSILHEMGFRFRIHRKDLPGAPDIVLPKYKAVIFVHGCFWHHHVGCKEGKIPKSNPDYWIEKFKKNEERDRIVVDELESMGWHVIVVWECELKDMSKLAASLFAEIMDL